MAETTTYSCEKCGATIYPEHIQKRRAGKVGGKLLCPMCVAERIKELQAGGAATPAVSGSGLINAASRESSGVVAVKSAPADAPLTLVDEDPAMASGSADKPDKAIRSFVKTSLAQADRHENFQRALNPSSGLATRCRTFHAKLTDAALSYMDNQINEWVEAHPDVHIKFATATIGMVEAKQHQEPNIILSVFY